jgi:hypothetical protein
MRAPTDPPGLEVIETIRTRQGAVAVLTKMQRGNTLYLSFERGMRRWLLSDVSSVSDEIAKLLIVDHRVINVGDALFKNMPGQTWRYVES